MPLTIPTLVAKLRVDFPTFTFKKGDICKWLPDSQEIHYIPAADRPYELLHEIAHALLGHSSYDRDITLIGMERDAWHYAATQLAPQYDTTIPDEYANEALESYRKWLHARATCPNCNATGVQTKRTTYICLACYTTWHVNEARTCQLRRNKITKKHPS